MATVDTYKKQADKYKQLFEHERLSHTKTKIKLKAKERELHTITNSQSYKVAKILAFSKHILRVSKNYAVALTPKRVKMIQSNRVHVKRVYKSVEFSKDLTTKPTSDTAVVLHLYYPEMLDYFAERLSYLTISYDLFITLPEQKKENINAIKARFPEARISLVPNCGRDVLPFIEVIRKIEPLGYKKVLKLHSKKSPHRDDGNDWRDRIVTNLVPKKEVIQKDILKKLSSNKTAIIGPSGEYVSLLVNYGATAHHTTIVISKLFNKTDAKELISIADEYGFFAGTMFWARIEALMPVIKSVHMTDFEPEFGQEDSTLAHAIERLFTLVPELEKRALYEVAPKGVAQIDYHTTNIPNWSELALED